MADFEKAGNDLYGASEGDSAGPGQDFSGGGDQSGQSGPLNELPSAEGSAPGEAPSSFPVGDLPVEGDFSAFVPVDEGILGGGADGSGQITGETPPEGPPPNAIGPTGDDQLDTDIAEATAPGDITTPDITLTPEIVAKDLKPGPKKVIKNPSLFDVSLLKSPDDLKNYLSDPIAFMGNYVWNYDVTSNQMVFRYTLPDDVIQDINKITNQFIKECEILIFNNKEVYNQDEDTNLLLRKIIIDNLFRQLFGKKVREFLESKYPNRDLSFLVEEAKITDEKFSPLFNENIKFFWFWLNQVCSKNVGVQQSRISINFNAESAKPLNLVFYYLVQYYLGVPNLNNTEQQKSIIPNEESVIEALLKTESTDKPKPGQKLFKSVQTYDYYYLLFIDAIKDNIFTNTNNYIRKNAKNLIVSEPVINFQGSPFFGEGIQSLSEKQKKLLAIPKIINECKNIDGSKDETSLKLFYKEGSDDILDKNIPAGNLGCSTKVKKWDEAKNIIFDYDSVLSSNPRKNLSLPYYNKLNVEYSTAIPKEVNIYEAFKNDIAKKDTTKLSSFFKSQKEFSTLATLKAAGDLELSEVLVDKSLVDGKNFKVANLILSSYEKGEGPTEFYKLLSNKNPELYVKGFSQLAPFNGVFPITSKVRKRREDQSIVQSFYVNVYDTNLNGGNKLYSLYDSQLKYGAGYKYELLELINFIEVNYQYENVFIDDTKEVITDTLSGKVAGRKIDIVFDVSQNYKNIINSYKQDETDLSTSYVDLPPVPLYMEVFPLKGMNDKLAFAFQKFSQSKKVIYKSISKKLWTEGWSQSREYYIKNSKIEEKSVPEDRIYFSDQSIKKINIYFKKGEKPTSLLEMTEKFGELNIFEDSYSKSFNLEPNVKYYFASKSESFTGLESYFSDVYEVELVDEGGTVFPIVKVVELGKIRQRMESISLSDKFRIQPAMLQQAPNIEKDTIGFLSPSVFSDIEETRPRFKVRLTSKKTGRKVDFNIIYKRKISLGALDAGELSVDSVKKEDILISYKSKFTEKAVSVAVDPEVADLGPGAKWGDILTDPNIIDVISGVFSDEKLIEAAIAAGFNATGIINGIVPTIVNYAAEKEKKDAEAAAAVSTGIISPIGAQVGEIIAADQKELKKQKEDLGAAIGLGVKTKISGDDLIQAGLNLTNPCCKSVLNVPDGVGGLKGETQKTDFKRLDDIYNLVKQKNFNKDQLFKLVKDTITPTPTLALPKEGVNPGVTKLKNLEALCYFCKRVEYKSTGKSLFAIIEEKLSGADLTKFINLIDCTKLGWQNKRGQVPANKFYWKSSEITILNASPMSLVVTGKCPVPTKNAFNAPGSEDLSNTDTTPGFTPNFGD